MILTHLNIGARVLLYDNSHLRGSTWATIFPLAIKLTIAFQTLICAMALRYIVAFILPLKCLSLFLPKYTNYSCI